MDFKLLSRFKILLYNAIVLAFFKAYLIRSEANLNITKEDVKVGLKAINFFEKIPDNLCPVEYDSCWCDYSTMKSVNNNENSNSYKTGSLSIMIDCQYFGENSGQIQSINENKLSNSSFNHKSSSRIGHAKKNLLEIPNVSNALAKFRYLGFITHLDLSHTGISEVPTDAFKVNRRVYLVSKNKKKLT